MSLTNHLIGKPGVLGPCKARINPKSPGFRAAFKEEYHNLTKELTAGRDENQIIKRKRKMARMSLNAGAAAASDAAFAEMDAKPSATIQKAKAKLEKMGGNMDNFVWKRSKKIAQWGDKVAHDQARMFIGCNFSDKAADSPLFHQFVKTLLEAGAAGATLPPMERALRRTSTATGRLSSRGRASSTTSWGTRRW